MTEIIEPTLEELASEYANIIYDGRPNEGGIYKFPVDGEDFNFIGYLHEKFGRQSTSNAIHAAFMLKEEQKEIE